MKFALVLFWVTVETYFELTQNCDLYLEFGNINIMCNILSNYGLSLISLMKFVSATFKYLQRNDLTSDL